MTGGVGPGSDAGPPVRARQADAGRNVAALLRAAKEVFATSGVDAPVRGIADRAGVGIATLYRHFPRRADLIAAVFRKEVDTCAAAAADLAATHPPFGALAAWLETYGAFVAVKRGLAGAVHSDDPAFAGLRGHFDACLRPVLDGLLAAAGAAGAVRDDVVADDLLRAIPGLCLAADDDVPGQARRMIALVVDGFRGGGRGTST